jgi:hypothetical protein
MKGDFLPDEFRRCGGHIMLDFICKGAGAGRSVSRLGPVLVQRDEQRDARQKDSEGGQKVAVRNNGFQRFWEGHAFLGAMSGVKHSTYLGGW